MRNALTVGVLLGLLLSGPASRAGEAENHARAMVHSNQGFLALESGETGKARKLFRRALKLAPELPSAHLGMGNLAMREGRYADAATAYEAERRGYRGPRGARVVLAGYSTFGRGRL